MDHARALLVDALDEAEALEDLERARIDTVCLTCRRLAQNGARERRTSRRGGRVEEGEGQLPSA